MTTNPKCPGSATAPDHISRKTGKGACDHCYTKGFDLIDGKLPIHARRTTTGGNLTLFNNLMQGTTQ